MKTKHKALLLTLCAVLLVAAGVFGTLAYLTDTESVKNTFTVGQISMTMDEAKVNVEGQKLDEDGTVDEDGENLAKRVTENTYHLLPGHNYIKDPTIHVDANSESCYVFIKVDNNGIEAIEEDAEGYTSVAEQILGNGWTWWKYEGNVHYFYQTYTKGQEKRDLNVFQQFKVGDSVTNEQLKAFYDTTAQENNGKAKAVVVTAYAIQVDGFTGPEAAWEAGNKATSAGGWLAN